MAEKTNVLGYMPRRVFERYRRHKKNELRRKNIKKALAAQGGKVKEQREDKQPVVVLRITYSCAVYDIQAAFCEAVMRPSKALKRSGWYEHLLGEGIPERGATIVIFPCVRIERAAPTRRSVKHKD